MAAGEEFAADGCAGLDVTPRPMNSSDDLHLV
jgi:hypothetical protein